MKYKTEYKTTGDLIFRVDNWIRFVGAVLVVYGKFSTPSVVTNEYLGTLQSDVLLIILGVLITIIGPDARKLLISKFSEGNNARND